MNFWNPTPSSLSPTLRRFVSLLEPVDGATLEGMARRSMQLTRRHFGRAVRMFAPIYLSNECINSCVYCGFSRENAIVRVTLEAAQVAAEARHLKEQGFRSLLLVAGEHPKFVSQGYLERCVAAVVAEVPSVAVEIAPLEVEPYRRLVEAGAEALVVYQETYDPERYSQLHVAGPKRDYEWRLACPERGYAAGFRRIGLGALFGLGDWRKEAVALASHLEHLLRVCWKSQFTLSLPRLRPCAGEFQPTDELHDRDFTQLLCAFRICFPQVGLVMSTREPAFLRDALAPLGVTMMSAGSHTEPGGYTGQGRDTLHRTVRGRQVALEPGAQEEGATEQFSIADTRSPAEVASALRKNDLEAVWKDWDPSITGHGLCFSAGGGNLV